ncbi:MAG TPA: BMP family protein [Anaerolineaceae bacterium]|nr:BMP family protein [Anaerolineaceae bacterium]
MIHKRSFIKILSVLALCAFVISACAPATQAPAATDQPAEQPAATNTKLRIAMALPGPINDNDFNTVGYSGLKAACEEMGIEFTYVEKVADADVERVLRDFASRGYNLIFAHSFSFASAALAVAKDYPDLTFMVAGSGFELAPNMGSYDNPDYQGAYLAGMLAAGTSKTGVLGWVDGNPAPNMLANLHAFEAGAKEINPEVKVLHTFIGSWYDPPKSKEAAIAQVEQGADVLSAQGVGVIDAAVEKKVFVIGAMTDQNHLGPEVVLTSVTWDIQPVVKAMAEAVMNGTWESKTYQFGVKEGAVKLADFHGLDSNVPADIMQKVNDKMAAIKGGSFTVTLDTSEVE